jgi:hypothetical protein
MEFVFIVVNLATWNGIATSGRQNKLNVVAGVDVVDVTTVEETMEVEMEEWLMHTLLKFKLRSWSLG